MRKLSLVAYIVTIYVIVIIEVSSFPHVGQSLAAATKKPKTTTKKPHKTTTRNSKPNQAQNPLRDYVRDDTDKSYAKYTLLETSKNLTYTQYILNVTSLLWFDCKSLFIAF